MTQVAHVTDVKALIKLRFCTSTRQPVVVLRSFQLTQKKTTMTFKSLDCTLQTTNRDTGEKQVGRVCHLVHFLALDLETTARCR